jgi:hypothetical protein
MGVVLVYTGEHYVLDLIAGVAYALVINAVVSRWERRRVDVAPIDEVREPVAVG